MAPTTTHRPRRTPVVTLRWVSNQRGTVLGLVVLLLIVFLGLAALAIDLGLLYVARGEAQRASDAAAHAGAVHLLRAPFDEDGARDRAVQAGAANIVRGQATEIRWAGDIDVVLDSQKVRARVHRTDGWGGPIGTLFARVIGFRTVGVATSAAAQAWPGEAADCIMPFAIPDHWYVDEDGTFRDAGIGDTYINDTDRQDLYIPAAEPDTLYDPPYSGDHPGYTGYGTDRIGQEIQLTSADPNDSPQPGWYYPIRLPGSQGGADYKASIQDCWEPSGEHELEDEVDKEPGNMVGPTQQGFADIFDDPDEQNIAWDDSPEWNCPRRTYGDDGAFIEDGDCVTEGSRRVRPLVMFNPEEWENIANGAKPVPITAIAGIFLDSWDGGNSVVVRFMTYTSTKPTSEWEMCADCLLRTVRIVE